MKDILLGIREAMILSNNTLEERTLKTSEEIGELAEAVSLGNLDGIKEEAVDVHLCAVSIIISVLGDYADIDSISEKEASMLFRKGFPVRHSIRALVLDMVHINGLISRAELSYLGVGGCTYRSFSRDDVVSNALRLAELSSIAFASGFSGNIGRDELFEEFSFIHREKISKWLRKAIASRQGKD